MLTFTPGTCNVSQPDPKPIPDALATELLSDLNTEFRSHACDGSDTAAFDVYHKLAVDITDIVS